MNATAESIEVNTTPELGHDGYSMSAIRKLSSLELGLYEEHLKRLSPDDRYLRFGYMITDAQIHRYVVSQMRIRSTILASFDNELNVIAAIEIVYDDSKYMSTNTVAEIGLSVEDGHRGKGLGSDLFRRALILARNRGVKSLVSHCLAQNRFMRKIAVANGMSLHSDGGDATGTLALPPADAQTVFDELLGEGMGMWDFGMLKMPSLFNYAAFIMAPPPAKKK